MRNLADISGKFDTATPAERKADNHQEKEEEV